MKSNDLTILFLSCDKYSDLWEPFFYCVHRYWPRCPYPMRLGSNTVSYPEKNINTVLSGPDRDWSSSLRAILGQIKTPYVFLWLDDMFPVSPVKPENFSQTVDFMIRHDAKHIHLEPTPQPDSVMPGGKYGIYEPGAPYRATVFGFWNIRCLYDLLLPGENPWNFEIMGSYRSRYTDGFYCAMQPILIRLNVVEKGRISQEAYEYCKAHSIPLNVNKRRVISNTKNIQSALQMLYFNAMMKVPWKIRLSAMNTLRKLLITY